MMRGGFWPRSLAGRTTVLLLVTGLLVYAGGLLAYRWFAEGAAESGRIAQIADRLQAVMTDLAVLPPAERPAAARALSSSDFRAVWSAEPMLDDAAGADAELREIRDRLTRLVPGIAARDVRLRWDEYAPAGMHHVVQGAVSLPDYSFLVFTAALLPIALPSPYGTLLAASTVFACVLVVAVFALRTINVPLRRLAESADRYGRELSVTLPERGPSEIVQVAQAFNAMQQRIRQLIEDRTQALAAVSHDLRTPIARLQLRCGLMQDPALRVECERDLVEMEAMVEATLAYLRGEEDPEVPRLTDIASLLATLIDGAVDAGHQASLSGPGHCVLMVRPVSVKRAFANLINNAVTYGGNASVAIQLNHGSVRILIDDDGPGIPESDIEAAFQPFQRLDASRNRGTGGVGLGLTIARRTFAREGGSLNLFNRSERGLRAEVILPVPVRAAGYQRPNASPSTALAMTGIAPPESSSLPVLWNHQPIRRSLSESNHQVHRRPGQPDEQFVSRRPRLQRSRILITASDPRGPVRSLSRAWPS
jgi:signal transduction histidine kinase